MKTGEIPVVREAIDRFTGQLVEQGVSPEKAREKATEAAIRNDRLRREGRIKK